MCLSVYHEERQFRPNNLNSTIHTKSCLLQSHQLLQIWKPTRFNLNLSVAFWNQLSCTKMKFQLIREISEEISIYATLFLPCQDCFNLIITHANLCDDNNNNNNSNDNNLFNVCVTFYVFCIHKAQTKFQNNAKIHQTTLVDHIAMPIERK